jgi:hypothetical protein
MPKYKCESANCVLYDQVISLNKARITIVNGTALDRNDWCPECENKRTLIREPGLTTTISGTNDQKLRMHGHI